MRRKNLMQSGSGYRQRRRFVALILLLSWVNTPSWTESLAGDESDFENGLGSVYTQAEVEAIVANLLADAEAELERTALEVAREVAAKDAGEIAIQQNLAECLAREKEAAEGGRTWWRKVALIELAMIAGEAIVLALSQ